MHTVYFNRGFSAYSFMISSLKAKWIRSSLKVVITHGSKDPYLMEVADHFEVEPQCSGEAYLDYILEVCTRHKVDVFFPRKHVSSLAQHRARFEERGIKVAFVGSAEHYALFDHKLNACLDLQRRGLTLIPQVELVHDYSAFQAAYERIRATSLDPERDQRETVCLKPNEGIGGKGFMRISHRRTELEDLFRESVHSISYTRLDRALREADPFPELLLSTYLSGDEISVDCIGDRGDLLAAYPRVYLSKHEQRFEDHPDLIEACREICRAYELSHLFNVQFKRHHGAWYFIELNTRSAAGAHRITALGVCPLSVSLALCLGEQPTRDLSISWGASVRRVERYERSE